MISENESWLLSYYRASEITGALFFGRVARMQRPGPVQADLTQHFADEANHASLFTECMTMLDARPVKMPFAYQDDYLQTAGPPTNFMEILSITHVFERRVLRTYAQHLKVPNTALPIKRTLQRIMRDERWHVEWVRNALRDLEAQYGEAHIAETLARHAAADEQTYGRFMAEHSERVDFLLNSKTDE